MTAFRLATRVVGTLNVDGMMHSITPRQWDEMVAYYAEEMDPLDRLAEILIRGFLAVCAALGKEMKPELLDPRLDSEDAEKPVQQSPDQQAAMIGMGAQSVGGNVQRGNRDR